MHLVFVASGIKHQLELFEKFLETHLSPFNYEEEGKKKKVLLQSQLRPINLYDFVFPKESLDLVLNSLGMQTGKIEGVNVNGMQAQLWALRKALKLNKIPKSDPNAGAFFLPKQNVRTVGIGIREDKEFINDKGVKQESI